MGTEKLLIKYQDMGDSEEVLDNDFDQIEPSKDAALDGYR